MAAGLILLGSFFDFFDGLTARILNINSLLGKQLDSLADLITFGLAPGIIVFQILFLLETNVFFNPFENWEQKTAYNTNYIPYIALLIPIFSALRLAKFNVDKRQHNQFIGLPTPANAFFFISIPLMMKFQPENFLIIWLSNTNILIIIIILMCLLMISEISLLSLKFKNLSWKDNRMRFIFITLILILLSQLHFAAAPIIILLYVILSIINNKKNEVYSKN